MTNEGRSLRISRWCKFFIKGNVAALLHSLSLAVVFVPRKTGQYLADSRNTSIDRNELSAHLDEDGIDTLIKENLLIAKQADETNDLAVLRDKLSRDIYLEMMYLIVADGCNLRCRYCFEDAPCSKDFKSMVMDEATAHKAIELFAKLTAKYGREGSKKVVHFYGGEPLLNFKTVQSSVLKIESMIQNGTMPKGCESVIITNGVLLTEQMAQFFAEHHVTIGLSLDGPKHINDLHRLAKNKEISVFDSAVRAYKMARKYGMPLGLSVALTPEVVENFDEVLNFFVDDLGIQDGISFNIMHYHPSMPTDTHYFNSAAKCLIKAFDRFRDLGIYEERMMRKAEAFVNREVMFADCGVIGNQIVVAPDGLVGVCQDFIKPRKYFGQSVFDTDYDPVRDGLFEEWRTRSPLFMKQCLDCEAVGICGGGCPASAELKTGNKWNVDERICPHSKLSLEWLIWQTYDKMVSNVQ